VAWLLGLLGDGFPPDAPPRIRLGLPVIGIVRAFASFGANPVAFIARAYGEYGPIFTLPVGFGFNFTFLIGLEAQSAFYKGKDEFLSQNEPYRFMTPIFGRGVVFDAPPETKREQLRFISGALRSDAMQSYVPLIRREAEVFFDSWGAEGECDLLQKMAELTINTASLCLLGRDVREKFGPEVAALLHDIDEGITPLAIIYPYLPTPAFRRRDAARARFVGLFGQILADRRRQQAAEPNAPKPQDLLQAFMTARYKDGSICSDDQITGLLIGALFAGQHTSSITTTWLALRVVADKDIYERVMREQRACVGEAAFSDVARPTGGLDFASVEQMNLLHFCMKEALRMAPPLIMLMRKVMPAVAEESAGSAAAAGGAAPRPGLRVGKYVVPPGHFVFASPAVSMNLPYDGKDGTFQRPERFEPDRFAAGRNEAAAPYSYSAFGGGDHACLGEKFGFLQVKTIVSVLLRTFELRLVGDMPEPNYKAMVVGPVQPLRVAFRRRKQPHQCSGEHVPFVPASAKAGGAAARPAAAAPAAAKGAPVAAA
jgi:sterol 14-demethylase